MDLLEGLLFAILWASATVATKFGLRSADPLLLACIRFVLVGVMLILYVYGIRRKRYQLPAKKAFKPLFILAFLNITFYIGAFVLAVQTVSAGLVSLFSATTPFIITLLSAVWLKRKVHAYEWMGMLIAFTGLALAAVPYLKGSHATLSGILILLAGQVSLSAGSVYYASVKLDLPKIVVNTWQTAIGGLLFIPLVLAHYNQLYLVADTNFYVSLGWLVIPVSIISYSLWLHLLNKDTVKAGMWLFVTPILGYLMAVIIMHEILTAYAITGALLVITGLWISKRSKK
jgi:drug/metabolite transporter (DMT)-like permease